MRFLTSSRLLASSDRSERRFPPRDRVWLGVNNVQLIATPQPLDRAAVQARINALAEAEPGLRFFTTASARHPDRYRDAGSPEQARRVAEQLVRPLPGHDIQAAADSAAKILDDDGGFPAPAVFAGHNLVGQRFPHVFGDGMSAVIHLRRLALGPDPDSKKAPFPIAEGTRPLATALRERYRRDPRQLLADLRQPRPAPASTGPRIDSDGRPQAVQILFRQLDVAAMNELKEFRKAHLAGVSTMATVVAALRRGLAREGLVPAADGMFVVFDLRSYLPRGVATGGNFINASYLTPADPLSGAAVNESIRQATASARPLLGLAVGAAGLATRRHTPLPQLRGPATSRGVAFSHMRVSGLLPPSILGGDAGPPYVLAAATPTSVGSISYTLVETGGQMSVTAVFCSPFTPREPMARVLDDLASAPAALLA